MEAILREDGNRVNRRKSLRSAKHRKEKMKGGFRSGIG